MQVANLKGHAQSDIVIIYADYADIVETPAPETGDPPTGTTGESRPPGKFVAMWFCTDMVTETRGVFAAVGKRIMFENYADMEEMGREVLGKAGVTGATGDVKFFKAAGVMNINGMSPFA